ncbi:MULTISPECIES: HipA family kinase [Rhizobium]|uniref:HipA-like kinase domain-containing protein n=1 Tax=Rhizobium laguerreae TaxID=1076926 RepID=A0ABR6G014_9HYPH|nr:MULTISPECIES: HipA family kinase [Rhizobium]MBB3159607.1 hypothetical protein [Rhizobium laguerreae]MBY5708874.1 hypothetical protein [Rhizobium leguminosarum]OOO47757.1 hypothetical protein BS630_15885 [Rhizobium laguerreae]
MIEIELATILKGAQGFKENNVNDTFRGQVLIGDGSIKQAVIKDLDLTQLCNELLAYSLAREVGLPVPDCYIGLARSDVLVATKAPLLKDGSRLVFVSIDVKVPNVTYRWTGSDLAGRKALFDEITQWGDLGHLYAYDAWIANIDRHPGNLLFGGKSEVWLIDHGHSFTGPDWLPPELDPEGEYDNRLSEWLTGHLTFAQKRKRAIEVRKFCTTIGSVDVGKTSKASRIASLLSETHVDALNGFLEKRVARVPEHASKALGVPVMI